MKSSIKKCISIRVLLFLLSLTVLSLDASDTRSDIEKHTAFGLINSFEKLMTPFTGGVAGAVSAGVPGMLVGVSFGLIDEGLIAFEYFDSPHLTSGLIGIAALSRFELPYHLSKILGYLGGVLFSKGLVSYRSSHSEVIVNNMINLGACFGRKGVLYGGTIGVLEKSLLDYNVTKSPYITEAFSSFAEAKVFAPMVLFIVKSLPVLGKLYAEKLEQANSPIAIENLLVVIIAVSLSQNNIMESIDKHENFEVNSQSTLSRPFLLGKKLEKTLSKIVDEKDLDAILKKQTLVLLGVQIGVARLAQIFSQKYQFVDVSMAALKKPNESNLKKFNTAAISLGMSYIPYTTVSLINSFLKNFFTMVLSYKAQDILREHYFKCETFLKLGQNSNSTALVEQMYENLNKVSSEGFILILTAMGQYVRGVFSIFTLLEHNSLDYVVFLKAISRVTEKVNIFINAGQKESNNKIKNLESKISSLQKDFKRNAKSIAITDQKELFYKKEKKLTSDLRNLHMDKEIRRLLSESWQDSKDTLHFIANNLFNARKLLNGDIPFSEFQIANSAGYAVLAAYSWYGNNLDNVIEALRSSEKLDELFILINEIHDDEKDALEYMLRSHDDNGIMIENVNVGNDEKKLLDDQSLSLLRGIYCVTGDSGSGKSSFLSKIKGLKHNGIWASGVITYLTLDGQSPTIHHSSQDDYIPIYFTLFELMSGENKKQQSEESELEVRVKELLNEIEIDANGDLTLLESLHEEKDWKSILSGGQKKKIEIIRTILRNPDIALLDEIFNCLDPASVRNVQRMLKTYLPNTLFLIVDHNLKQNNYDNFYDYNIHLEDKKLNFKKLP